MNNKISLPTIWPVTRHTDYVGPQSTFFAIKGMKEDGITYIPLALQKGARTIITYHDAIIPENIKKAIDDAHAQLLFVDEPRKSLALLSAQAWGNPAQKLKIYAITGTKGKTTTAWLLAHLLKTVGYKTALLSTVENHLHDQVFATDLTTQHPDYLHAFFHACVKAGVTHVVMEVAAQSTSLHRSDGLLFDGFIFTNFENAHGEFYNSEHEYFAAKCALFDQLKPDAHIVLNADAEKVAALKDKYPLATTFGIANSNADFTVLNPSSTIQGISGQLIYNNQLVSLACPALLGSFNASNMLAAVSMALIVGIPVEKIQQALQTFHKVPGRLERYVLPNGATCIIDYAHNPASFRALLPLLRSMTDHVIVVSGAGGDRDRTMRPELGNLMATFADLVILTADNPRGEDPAHIIQDILLGIPENKRSSVICEIDRQKAIQCAYAYSKPTSIIALLGKGPEQYQIVGTAKIPFSERTIIQALL